jgi:hypothetical protein
LCAAIITEMPEVPAGLASAEEETGAEGMALFIEAIN